MTFKRLAVAAATAALLAAPIAADAQNTLGRKGAPATASPSATSGLVTADQLDVILAGAQLIGDASLGETNDGEPQIEGTVDGINYFIWFYGCQSVRGDGCSSIQYSAAFNTDGIASTTLNAWNRDFRYGSAYLLDDGTLVIQWSVNLDGGVSADNLADTMGLWRDTIDAFLGHFAG